MYHFCKAEKNLTESEDCIYTCGYANGTFIAFSTEVLFYEFAEKCVQLKKSVRIPMAKWPTRLKLQRPNTRNLRIRSLVHHWYLARNAIRIALIAKIQRTFIRNTQQLSCCFNLRGLRLLLWHKKISWQQFYKEQNKMLLFRLGNSFRKNYILEKWRIRPFYNSKCCFNHSCFEAVLASLAVWQYGLWSFQMGYTKLERFLHKNQHTRRKLLNFENWTNGEPQ